MNSVVLVGTVVEAPHFHWLRQPGREPQAFLACQLRLRGAANEPDTLARVVIYGPDAERLYPILNAHDLLEVNGRYRVRLNPEAQAKLAQLMAVDDQLARLLHKAVQVHEFVAHPHQAWKINTVRLAERAEA